MAARQRRVLVVTAVCAIAAAACGDDADDSGASSSQDERVDTQEPREDEGSAPLYGRDGELLESDRRVAGLVLPRGLDAVELQEERRHVYRSDVPLDKLLSYFGPRLMTGTVDRMGEGVIYRGAVPRDVQRGAVELDVKIVPGSAANRVEVEEIRPPPTNPPSLEQLRHRTRNRRLE